MGNREAVGDQRHRTAKRRSKSLASRGDGEKGEVLKGTETTTAEERKREKAGELEGTQHQEEMQNG